MRQFGRVDNKTVRQILQVTRMRPRSVACARAFATCSWCVARVDGRITSLSINRRWLC